MKTVFINFLIMNFQDFKNETKLVGLKGILDQFSEEEKILIEKISDGSNFGMKIPDQVIDNIFIFRKFQKYLTYFSVSYIQNNNKSILGSKIRGEDFQKILSTRGTGFLGKSHKESDLLSICESFYSLLGYSKGILKKSDVLDITEYFRSYTIGKGEIYFFDKIGGFRKYFSCLNGYYSNHSEGGSHRLVGGIYYNSYSKENDLPIIDSLESQITTSQYLGENIDEFIDTKIVFIVPDSIFDTQDFRDDNLESGLGGNNLYYYLGHKDFQFFSKLGIKESLIMEHLDYKFSEISKLKSFLKKYKYARHILGKDFNYAYKEAEQLLLDYDKKRNMLSNVL